MGQPFLCSWRPLSSSSRCLSHPSHAVLTISIRPEPFAISSSICCSSWTSSRTRFEAWEWRSSGAISRSSSARAFSKEKSTDSETLQASSSWYSKNVHSHSLRDTAPTAVHFSLAYRTPLAAFVRCYRESVRCFRAVSYTCERFLFLNVFNSAHHHLGGRQLSTSI